MLHVVGVAISLGSVRAQSVCQDTFVFVSAACKDVDFSLPPITYSVNSERVAARPLNEG